MNRQDLVAFLLLAGIVIGLGGGMRALHTWLQGDWRHLTECEESYWTCVAEFEGRPPAGGRDPLKYLGLARSCEEYRAYESAIRRADFNCRTSGVARIDTCREVDIHCSLPRANFY